MQTRSGEGSALQCIHFGLQVGEWYSELLILQVGRLHECKM